MTLHPQAKTLIFLALFFPVTLDLHEVCNHSFSISTIYGFETLQIEFVLSLSPLEEASA